MDISAGDRAFSGSIPLLYERLLVPLLFRPYALDLAERAGRLGPRSVLEIAAGTGALTRELARALPAEVPITATDLNQPMIDLAETIEIARPVDWQQADAASLPFRAGSFDLVICQFGFMFFPDKAGAAAEIRRVLRPGGCFLFNVWDRIEANDFTDEIESTLALLYPADPPRFMSRVPHGYHDPARIAADLKAGGFGREASFEVVTRDGHADTPLAVATAFCQATPLRTEIEARDPAGPERATGEAAEALARHFGPGPIEGMIQAWVVAVTRD